MYLIRMCEYRRLAKGFDNSFSVEAAFLGAGELMKEAISNINNVSIKQ